MLKPRELFNGPDFPPTYMIDADTTAESFQSQAQVRKCAQRRGRHATAFCCKCAMLA
jgi:hypothetical protein